MSGGETRNAPVAGIAWLAALLLMASVWVGASDASPQVLIRSVTSNVLDTLRDNGDEFHADPGKLVALIEKEVVPYFDFRVMSGQVLGRYWRTASEQQREAFTGAFRRLLTNTYAAVFGRYRDQAVEVLGARSSGRPDRVLVQTLVKSASQPDIRVDYRMYDRQGKWQIYDVVVDGISLLINYRSEYTAALANDNLDSLIARLKEKNASFPASAPN